VHSAHAVAEPAGDRGGREDGHGRRDRAAHDHEGGGGRSCRKSAGEAELEGGERDRQHEQRAEPGIAG
jgi:hypothetical protein